MLILSHFSDSAKFNLTLLNLNSDVLNNNLPIIFERILNSNRGMVNFKIGQEMLTSSHHFCDNVNINCPFLNQLYRPYFLYEVFPLFKRKSDINDFGNAPKIKNSIKCDTINLISR